MDTSPSKPSARRPVWVVAAQAGPAAELRRRLESSGADVRNGPEGCAVALLDFRLPGAEAELARLRADASTRDLPVIALVDARQPVGFQQALASGADELVNVGTVEVELAARVERALDRQRERDLALRRERDLAALLELTGDYAQSLDATELLHKVTRRLADELGIARCALVLVDAEGEHGLVVAASDDQALRELPLDLAHYPEIREAMRTGRPLVLPDASSHPLLDLVKEKIARQNIGAIAAVPLAAHGRVLGVMLLRAGPARRTFSPREIDFASTVAHATAVALRNAKLLETAQAKVADLARYEGLFNALSQGIAAADARGNLLTLNPSGARLLGFEAERVKGRPLTQALRTLDEAALAALLAGAREGRDAHEVDVPVEHADGRRLILAMSGAPLEAGQGAVVLAFRDVTRPRRLEAELRKTKELIERLVDQAVDAIIAADMKGTVIVFNKGAERICGYRADEVVGKVNVRELYPLGLAPQLMRKIRDEAFGGRGRLEPTRAEILTRSGERVPVNMTAALITEDVDGKPREVASVGIFSDLRDRMSLEMKLSKTQEKLEQTEKTAMIAELAGTAAHELNQPLTSIMGYAELMRRRLRESDPSFRSVDIIFREAERMAEIVRKIGKITRYETKAYVGTARIVDLDRASGSSEDET